MQLFKLWVKNRTVNSYSSEQALNSWHMSGNTTVMPSPLLTGYYYFNQYWNNQVNKHFIRLVGNSSGGGAAQNSDLWNGNLFSWSRPPCFCPQRDSHRDSWLDLNKRHRVGTSLQREPSEDRVRTDRRERPSLCHGKVSTSKTAALWGNIITSFNFAQRFLQMVRWGNIWKVWSSEIMKSETAQIGTRQSETALSLIALYQRGERD